MSAEGDSADSEEASDSPPVPPTANPIRGFAVEMRKGEPWFPPASVELSAREWRKREAYKVVQILVDAVSEAARRPGIDDYHAWDFWLPARLVLPLMPADHPQRPRVAAIHEISPDGRIHLQWPHRVVGHVHFADEERDKPLQLLGLLIEKILEGDYAFFSDLVGMIKLGKKRRKKPQRFDNVAGAVAIPQSPIASLGGAGWFELLNRPPRKGMAPYEVWRICKAFNRRGSIPTRRDLRVGLEEAGISAPNWPALLKRMGLWWLPEGKRPRGKRSTI